MKKHILKLAAATPLVLASFASFASPATDELRAALQQKYPTSTFSEINETPVQGIYELVTGKNIFYTDKSGSYLFFGSLYDMKNSRDITQERRAALNKVDFSSLNLKDAIKEVRGDGSRVFAVFTDPDCPFCKQLENSLKDVDNVTIYRFLYPLVQLHPGADTVAKKVWCVGADDTARQSALEAYMLGGVTPTGDSACENPVQRNIAQGEKLDIRGTPTLIAADGRLHPGAASAPDIEAWLNAGAKQAAQSNVAAAAPKAAATAK